MSVRLVECVWVSVRGVCACVYVGVHVCIKSEKEQEGENGFGKGYYLDKPVSSSK